MINLIPKGERKKIVRSFYFRFLTVAFLMLGVGALIACIAILPSYFLASVKSNLAADKLDSQQHEKVPELDQKTLGDIKDLESKLNLVDKSEKSKYLPSERIFNEVILKKTPNIRITSLSYEVNLGEKTVSLEGIATNRETLLDFRRSLESDPLFKKVDLPISNFIKGSNIEFSLHLTPA